MKVKLVRLGHSAQEIDLPDGTSLQEALTRTEVNTEGQSISVNGVGSMLNRPLSDGDVITMTPKVTGGSASL